MDGLERVPMKFELMRHFNMESTLIKEMEPYFKEIFDGKLANFNKNRAIVNEWVKKYLPQEWKDALAERDKHSRKRSGLPPDIKQIRDRAQVIMQKVKYRVDIIRDSIEWDKIRVGVSSAGGCAAEDEDTECADIPFGKMELRSNLKPPVRLDPSHVPSMRTPSPNRRRESGVVHRATAVVVNNNTPVFISEQQVFAAVPEEDDMNTVISDLSDLSFPSIHTVHANPLDDN